MLKEQPRLGENPWSGVLRAGRHLGPYGYFNQTEPNELAEELAEFG